MKTLKLLNLLIRLLEFLVKTIRSRLLFPTWLLGWFLFGFFTSMAVMPSRGISMGLFYGSGIIAVAIPLLGAGIEEEGYVDSLKRKRFKLQNGYEPYDPVI